MVEISDRSRQQRFAPWEEMGADRTMAGLLDGGYKLVGSPPEARELAWEWVRGKEPEAKDTEPRCHVDPIGGCAPEARGFTACGRRST